MHRGTRWEVEGRSLAQSDRKVTVAVDLNNMPITARVFVFGEQDATVTLELPEQVLSVLVDGQRLFKTTAAPGGNASSSSNAGAGRSPTWFIRWKTRSGDSLNPNDTRAVMMMILDRRQFLSKTGKTTLGPAGIVILSNAQSVLATPANNKVMLGIIDVGGHGGVLCKGL
jgi:hypothetical protein